MKKLLLIVCSFAMFLAQAQTKEGTIVYERIIQTPARILSANPEVAKHLPKSRTDNFELLFTNGQSLWKFLPNANNEEPGTINAPGVVMRFSGGANEISFQNLEKGTRVEQREVMNRQFIVSDTIPRLNWKLTGETKQVINFTVHKAVAQNIRLLPRVSMENGEMKHEQVADTVKVVAWYTTDMPVAAGPDYQGQLPGVILELDINNGQTLYKALEFSPKVTVAKIKEPKDGKKVTALEFQKEREKLLEEMRKNMPSSNVIRIN